MKKLQINDKIKLFLVDDDKVYLKLLTIELNNTGNYEIETFDSGEDCVANLSSLPDLIILDYNLDGINPNSINGIATIDIIKAFNPDTSVIMLSAQDSIDVAIQCMHHGAFDYVVKSSTAFIRLQNIIPKLFKYKKMEKELKWYIENL